jgi:hypothetical protein
MAARAVLVLLAMAAGDPAADLREARAQEWRARSEPAVAEAAWLASMRAAERALRALAPAWAEAVDRGEEAARAARLVEASGAEALYRMALGAMGLARQRGFAAVLAASGTALPSMERAAELEPGLDQAGPHRALGSWYAVLPSAGGGGAGRSRAAFARARQLAPACLLARVEEAETLALLLQDRERFDRLLGEVLAPAARGAPPAAAEDELARHRARELLARRDLLFR